MKSNPFQSFIFALFVVQLVACGQKSSPDSPSDVDKPVPLADKSPPKSTGEAKESPRSSSAPVSNQDSSEPVKSESNDPKALPLAKPLPDAQDHSFAKPGFLNVQNPELPAKVKLASASVYEIRVLGASDENSLRLVNLTKETDTEEKIKNSTNNYDAQEKDILLSQLARCKEDPSMVERCFISLDIAKSSGFLLNDGQELWTTAHSINRFIKARAKFENIDLETQVKKETPLRIFIYDQNGRKVFDGYKDKAIIKNLPQKTPAAEMEKEFFSMDSDFIVLKLSRQIGQPLKRANVSPKAGDQTFVVGYPACTGCDTSRYVIEDQLDFADRSPAPNSSGQGLMISSGHWLNFYKIYGFFGVSLEKFKIWDLTALAFYSADSQHGQSGSPVVNADGEVVAIHTGGKSRNMNGKIQRISRGVIPLLWNDRQIGRDIRKKALDLSPG